MTLKWIVLLPIVIPFSAALLLLINRTNKKYQHGLSLLSATTLLWSSISLIKSVLAEGVLVVHMGNWRPPFGIVFAVDLLGAIMVAIAAVVGLTSLLFAFHDIQERRMQGAFYALFQFLLFGINGAFLTGDLFNLFVFFEVLLMTSYVLLVLGNENKQTRVGFSYLTLNLIGSTVFLAAAGIIYALIGTLNMAHIADRISNVPNQGLVTIAAMLLFFVFGLKSAMFPLNTWLPDAYTAPPTPISAIFAGLMTKVGVYSMFRVFGTIFVQDHLFTHHTLLIPLAGLTMVLGVWGAVVQINIRSILAFHSISQVGYILMGLAIFHPLALAGGIFHMIHHSLIKSSLFLIGGSVQYAGGSQNLKKVSGLVSRHWPLALLFIISAMALSGIPPLSGFFSKYVLVLSGLKFDHPILVFAALFTSLFTLYSMIKIWRLGFWGESKDQQAATPVKNNRYVQSLVSCGVSVVFVVLLTICAKPIMNLCVKTGEQLKNRHIYIQKVLTSVPIPYRGRY